MNIRRAAWDGDFVPFSVNVEPHWVTADCSKIHPTPFHAVSAKTHGAWDVISSVLLIFTDCKSHFSVIFIKTIRHCLTGRSTLFLFSTRTTSGNERCIYARMYRISHQKARFFETF